LMVPLAASSCSMKPESQLLAMQQSTPRCQRCSWKDQGHQKRWGLHHPNFWLKTHQKWRNPSKILGVTIKQLPKIGFNHLFLGFYHQKNRGRTIESWNLTTKPLKISCCDTQKQGISQQVVKSPVLNGTGWWFQPIHFQCARHPKYRSFLI
jgi:hypothetical protein